MKSWSLLAAVAAGCFGFAAAFTVAPSHASALCDRCADRYDLCIERITSPSQKAECAAQFRLCRANNCP